MYQEEIDKLINDFKCAYLRVKNTIQKFCKENPDYKQIGDIDIQAPNGNDTKDCLSNIEFKNFLLNN